jgi:catechol 2,3-dioxygenase-like lactoylglutathione lyase family enzyme
MGTAMKIDHITLMVSSLERSMPYYEQLLPLVGFRKVKSHIFTDGEGFFFQFLQAKAGTSPYERYGAGMNHLGFCASSPEQVHDIRRAMMDKGFDVPAVQDLHGAIALFMKDPDGIRFEITYYPPGASVVD